MNWEIRIDMYTLICIKRITNKNLLYKKINKRKFKKKRKNKAAIIIKKKKKNLFIYLFILAAACGILVPQPGI